MLKVLQDTPEPQESGWKNKRTSDGSSAGGVPQGMEAKAGTADVATRKGGALMENKL